MPTIGVIIAAFAAWVWTGPDVATARLTCLTPPAGRAPASGMWAGRESGESGQSGWNERGGRKRRRSGRSGLLKRLSLLNTMRRPDEPSILAGLRPPDGRGGLPCGVRFNRLNRLSRGRETVAWRLAMIELCQGIVAELASGRTPDEAICRAISAITSPDSTVLRPVSAVARDGGDVAAALQRAAPDFGGEGFMRLAACWRASLAAGGGLMALIERVAVSLREAEEHRQDVAAQLAGPRATARLLAVLPLLGLLMAVALGMDPLSFLLGHPAGGACLAAGLTLDAAGLWWTNRLVTRAEGLR